LLLLYELNSFCLLKVFPPLKDDTWNKWTAYCWKSYLTHHRCWFPLVWAGSATFFLLTLCQQCVLTVNFPKRHNFPKLNPVQLKYGSAVVGCVAPKLQIESVFQCTTPTWHWHFWYIQLLLFSQIITCVYMSVSCLVSLLHRL
jgi:hypothetical protein